MRPAEWTLEKSVLAISDTASWARLLATSDSEAACRAAEQFLPVNIHRDLPRLMNALPSLNIFGGRVSYYPSPWRMRSVVGVISHRRSQTVRAILSTWLFQKCRWDESEISSRQIVNATTIAPRIAQYAPNIHSLPDLTAFSRNPMDASPVMKAVTAPADMMIISES